MSKTIKHILFWLTIYICWTYIKSGGGHPEWLFKFMLINIVNLIIYISIYYTLKHIQIPKLYNKKKIGLFTLSILSCTIIAYVFWRVNGLLWIDELRRFNKAKNFGSFVDYITQSIQFYSPAMLLLVFDIMQERRNEKDRIQQLEKEKLETELKFLKAQINPHFLFNTLNNLYSFVINNSPQAPDMILRLSAILDYVLHDSQKERVILKQEVKAIENFIGLEQIRYGDRLEVEFESKGNLSVQISPLILLSIVENAFKHGASGDIDSPKIKIDISELLGTIQCNVWNTKSKYDGELNDKYKSGIGLRNIKRQLNLIYPNQSKLVIDDLEHEFNLSLTISPVS